jgi:hypothetical protein
MVTPARASLRADRLRAVNEPRPVTVELDESGAPTAIQQSGGRADGRTGGKIEAILETWRIEDEWWRQPISRVYVEIIIEGGRRVVLFSDLITREWFMQQP